MHTCGYCDMRAHPASRINPQDLDRVEAPSTVSRPTDCPHLRRPMKWTGYDMTCILVAVSAGFRK
jgi:hypothetical protein